MYNEHGHASVKYTGTRNLVCEIEERYMYIVYVQDTWQTKPYCAGAFRELVRQHEEQALGLQRQAQQALRGYQQMGSGQLTVHLSVFRIRNVYPGSATLN
jgi:hypothetical protein